MKSQKELAVEIAGRLQERGHIGLLVGGCVRDELLHKAPKDFDVVTSATAEQLESWFPKTVAVGKSFGTITVVEGDAQVQVSTLRNCRQSGVAPAADEVERLLKDDASDRDFTFNALYRDPVSGVTHDFFGGQADLHDRRIRTVGGAEERFSNDRLRMLRALRFASTLGFAVDPAIIGAIKRMAERIREVSYERIRDEFRKLLLSQQPLRGLDLMMETGLMEAVLPEVIELAGASGDQDPVWHPEGNVWVHTRMVLQELVGSSFELMMAGFLHDIGKPATQERADNGRISNINHAEVGAVIAEKICDRFKLSKEETSHICEMVGMHMRLHDVDKMRRGKLAVLLERPDIHELIMLQHADSVGTQCECRFDKSRKNFLEAKLAVHRKQYRESPFQRIITGQVLIAMGYTPGPAFREILDEAACAQREGTFADIESGKQWITANYDQ